MGGGCVGIACTGCTPRDGAAKDFRAGAEEGRGAIAVFGGVGVGMALGRMVGAFVGAPKPGTVCFLAIFCFRFLVPRNGGVCPKAGGLKFRDCDASFPRRRAKCQQESCEVLCPVANGDIPFLLSGQRRVIGEIVLITLQVIFCWFVQCFLLVVYFQCQIRIGPLRLLWKDCGEKPSFQGAGNLTGMQSIRCKQSRSPSKLLCAVD